MGDAENAPILSRGVGAPSKCRSCKASIVFAKAYATGKNGPYQLDDVGEWVLENGIAKHVGPVPAQLELGAPPQPQRYTSHFAVCPQASSWRQER